jgi:hypothetical protein
VTEPTVTAQPAPSPSSEPLLWLQLLALAVLPLEALLLLLLLAGADPGPFPALERLLAWALGALAPAALFWRLPPDLWSLLLVQVPLRGRRPLQMRLSALQQSLPLRLLAAAGALLLLPLLWWSDGHAAVAWAMAPLASSPRLVALLLTVPLLAVMLWQWQQLVQALWMLLLPPAPVQACEPLSVEEAASSRLAIGLPLLLLPALSQPACATPLRTDSGAEPATPSVTGGVGRGVAVTPEQGSEQTEGTDLDQQI